MGETKKLPGCSLLAIYRRMFRGKRNRSSSTSSNPQCGSDATARLPSPIRQPDRTAIVIARAPLKYKPSAAANKRLLAQHVPASPRTSNGFSGELDSMIYDHQRVKGSSSLVRATSGNMMVFGDLGNIRSNKPKSPKSNLLDYISTNETNTENNVVVGNIVKKIAKQSGATSKRLDSEELMEMGNEAYKQGRIDEALALYDKVVLDNPGMASYRSNRAAALSSMGRLLEAVDECIEALKIEPSYTKAHYSLATLYLRLGQAEKAVVHYKLSRNEADFGDLSQVRALDASLTKCDEARKLGDWNTMLREAKSAVSAGADSAPLVFAWQAEALLKLDRHDLAEKMLKSAPKFDINASTKIFGAARNAYVLMVRGEVDIAAGRFEDAAAVAQIAAQLDPGNDETSNTVKRARAIASARSNGNALFKASNFGEACTAYQEGLNHVPRNAILLCNRAACHHKLGQWERAVEDCTTALSVRPSYAKARLRRADCNAKLERWEASVKDYQVLINELPGDEGIRRALSEAQEKLSNQRH